MIENVRRCKIPTLSGKLPGFCYTLMESRFATSSKKTPVPTWSWDVGTDWNQYVQMHVDFGQVVWPKAMAPGIVHGDSHGHHASEDTESCTALVVDCDAVRITQDEAVEFSGALDLRHMLQWRSGKFHIVFPLAVPLIQMDKDEVRARRKAALIWLQQEWGITLDKTPAALAAILHPYSRQSESDIVLTLSNDSEKFLDLDALLGEIGYTSLRKKAGKESTWKQDLVFGTNVHEALKRNGYWIRDFETGEEKAPIRCPFHPDESKGVGDTSTIVFASGWILCAHNRCEGRRQSEYWAKIGLAGDLSAEVRLMLEGARVQKVSLDTAGKLIRKALLDSKPYAASATVVRVTTGAGKTRAVAEFLDSYCAPKWDSETGDVLPGRTAILATPTNALLREVSARLKVEHKTATGVLAVLDGSGFACKKWTIAHRLQERGGDVHRLMCSECQYKVGCPAREGARVGEGSLTLTNHALLPSLVREAREAGKIPLIVWDESPQFIEVLRLKHSDLDWMVNRFEEEDNPQRLVTLDRLREVVLFSDKYRIAIRPLVEVLRRMIGGVSLTEAVSDFGGTRLCESMLHRAESFFQLPTESGVWERIRACASAADTVNVAERMFDSLPEDQQELVLRAEGINKAMRALLRETVLVTPQPGALDIAALTPHGEIWKQFGGVILDATAPIHDLLGMRSDASVMDIAVEDRGESQRFLVVASGLGRRVLKEHPERGLVRLGGVGDVIRSHLKSLEKKLGRVGSGLVVCYRDKISVLEGALAVCKEAGWNLEFAWYGNTRGYDSWYQRGFDFFVTVGDPYSNIASEDKGYDLLGIQNVSLEDYCAYRARAEAAQAHGRARSPQDKKTDGLRVHLHFGRLAPLGWDDLNTIIELE